MGGLGGLGGETPEGVRLRHMAPLSLSWLGFRLMCFVRVAPVAARVLQRKGDDDDVAEEG